MTSRSMRTVRHDIYYTVVSMLYVVGLAIILYVVIMTFTILRHSDICYSLRFVFMIYVL